MIIAKLKSPIVKLLESHLTDYRGDIIGQALDEIKRLEKDRAELLEALKACCIAIEQEVNQGDDEDHPTLNAHRKVAEQGRAAVTKATGEK